MEDKRPKKNLNLIEEMFDCTIDIEWRATSSLKLHSGQRIKYGTVSNTPDEYGFFTFESDWNETELCCLCNEVDIPSLYKGNL